MTSPRYWTDYKTGVSYAHGEKIPYTYFNQYLTGLKAYDLLFERQVPHNWPYSTGIATYAAVTRQEPHTGAVWSEYSKLWLFPGEDSGTNDPIVAAIPSGMTDYTDFFVTAQGGVLTTDNTTQIEATDIACDPTGQYVVIGGKPVGGAMTQKYRHSADGGKTWVVGISSYNSTAGILRITYDSLNELFISTSDAGQIETCTKTGTTWSARTPAHGNYCYGLHNNGTISVAIGTTSGGAATDKCQTSANGTTWTERTMASSRHWEGVTYLETPGTWVAVGRQSGVHSLVINTSSDGITWTDPGIYDDGPESAVSYCKKAVSLGNLLVVLATGESGGSCKYKRIMVSENLTSWYEAYKLNPVGVGVNGNGLAVRKNTDGKACSLAMVDFTEYYQSLVI